MNGDLRVAYRASPLALATSCSSRIGSTPASFSGATIRSGWVEAMTSLGRLIFFDQPGSGASDPVEPGALPTLEQWADSITAVLDDLGSRRSSSRRVAGAFPPAALFAATYPSRTTALVVLEGYADPFAERNGRTHHRGIHRCHGRHVGHGGCEHFINPDMPWNEEIRAAWARMNAWRRSPGTVALLLPLCDGWTCGRSFRQSACPLSSSSTPTTSSSRPHGQVHR